MSVGGLYLLYSVEEAAGNMCLCEFDMKHRQTIEKSFCQALHFSRILEF